MKAITLTEPSTPTGKNDRAMALRDVPDPHLGPDQILVDVRAAGIDPRELGTHGSIPGCEVAGVVVARGPDVTGFVVGDEVYAWTDCAYAERVAVAERDAAHKPAVLSFAEAAAVPLGALTALQALRAAGTGEGDVVLVHAAAGGPGHFAVQLARALGAERVLGTAAPADHDFLRELGAEPVPWPPEPVDVALDLQGDAARPMTAQVRDSARAVSTVDATIVQSGGRYLAPHPDTAGLQWLAALADEGRLRVNLHRELPLAEAADAHRLMAAGGVRGKLVLTP